MKFDASPHLLDKIVRLLAIAILSAIAGTSPADTPHAAAATGPVAGLPWTNSLGMKFAPAGTDGVLFSIWDVRLKDFKAFVDATGYDATKGVISMGTDGWKPRGDTWKNPGFTQTEDDPVAGVNWDDAKTFCQWLTKKETAEGSLAENQQYRLPGDAEWSKAVGLDESSNGTPASKSRKIDKVYPWGSQWPPPPKAGNYPGSEAADAKWPRQNETIAGYVDGYPRTSPVGSFAANRYGLYDMGGNVWQWCEDKYDTGASVRVLRGGAFYTMDADNALSSFRGHVGSGIRLTGIGFRVVVVVSPSSAH